MIDAAPSQGESTGLTSGIEAASFLPTDRSYYSYTGSLTTAPYTEGVRWQVMADALEASAGQVAQLAALTGGGANGRPLQPLNGRQITAHGIGWPDSPTGLGLAYSNVQA